MSNAPAPSAESTPANGEIQEPIAHVLKRPWLMRAAIALATMVCLGTTTAVATVSLRRQDKLETQVQALHRSDTHQERRADWMAYALWTLAQAQGVPLPPPPTPTKETP